MLNFLTQLKFQFTIQRLPNVTFYVQATTLPSLSLQPIEVNTQKNKIFQAGNKIEYGELSVTFRVDEQMQNYQEIHDWMIGLGAPENYDQYKKLKESEYGLFSDGTLIILNSSNRPTLEISYKNMFPTSLGELSFDMRSQDVEYLDCTATFRYDTFFIIRR